MTYYFEHDDDDRRFRILADSMPQIVWTARPDGWVDYYNQRWFDYTGMSGRETHGWGWGLAVHHEHLDAGIHRWQQAVASGLPFEMLIRLKRKSDGSYRWHLVRALPARDSCGRIIKWFGSCTDIDDLKAEQDARQRSATETARLLDERSALLALANEQLLLALNGRRQAEEDADKQQQHMNEIIKMQALLAQLPFDPAGFAHVLVNAMPRVLPVEAAVVELLDGEQLVYGAASGSAAALTGRRESPPALAARCLRDGELQLAAADGADCIAVAPLLRGGTVVGVLKAIARPGSRFAARELQLLQLLAGLMSAALAIGTRPAPD